MKNKPDYDPDYDVVHFRGKWAAEWYENGKRRRASLRTADRDAVPAAVQELHARLQAERERKAAQKPATIDVAWCWAGYVESLGDKASVETMGHQWKALSPHFGALRADGVTEQHCQEYTARRRAAGRSDGTIWSELGRLRSALLWAEKRSHITKAPHIVRPAQPEPRDVHLTKAEAAKFLAACELPHVRLFVTLALSTAGRMSALLGLTWDRVDFERGRIDLHDPERARTGKGRATVPMTATARAALAEAHKWSTSRFVIEWGGERVMTIKKGIAGAAARSGLQFVTPHVFRHTAAVWMAESRVPMTEIARYLGHRDSRVTERVYAKFSPDYLNAAASALDF
jgi:integrase